MANYVCMYNPDSKNANHKLQQFSSTKNEIFFNTTIAIIAGRIVVYNTTTHAAYTCDYNCYYSSHKYG